MTEQAPERIFSGINIPKVLAGALAAVCAAVVGSFLGVAGTLIGAAVASIVGSVGTEIYERSLQRTAKKLQTLAPAFVKAPAAVGTPEVAAAAEEDSPSHTVAGTTYKRKFRWGHIAAAAAGVFILAMGAITLYEWIAGEPLASAVGASSDKGNTLSNLGNNSSTKEKPAPASSATPTDRPATDGTAPTTAPSGGATSAPATGDPTTAPAADSTGDTPQSTTDPDTGTGSGSGGGLDSSSGSDGGSGGGTDGGTGGGSSAGSDSGAGGGAGVSSPGDEVGDN